MYAFNSHVPRRLFHKKSFIIEYNLFRSYFLSFHAIPNICLLFPYFTARFNRRFSFQYAIRFLDGISWI